MKGRIVALGRVNTREAAALIVDGRLQDFLIDPDRQVAPPPGTVFRAICDRALKGQGAMMLRLPAGRRAFLRQAGGLRPGQAVLVQVSGYAETGKAIPVTMRLLFKGRYAIVTPDAPGVNISRRLRDEDARARLREIAAPVLAGVDGIGLILRSSCRGAAQEAIAADIAAMRDVAQKVLAGGAGSQPELLLEGAGAHALALRDWDEPDLLAEGEGAFDDHAVHDLLEALACGRHPLPHGACAFVEPTRALVAVDVNTGPDTSLAAGLKANIALARELPRILRCLGLGGQITIDFAPLARKDRRQVEQVLKAAFRRDPIDTALAGWTPLGHFELQRKRERLPVLGGELG